MLIGKPSIPLLITKTLHQYKTNRGVKCEVYAIGTSSSPGELLTTLTLAHQSGGTYAVHYTPPENHDILDMLFKIYTDTTYATLDNAYGPMPEQLYLAGLSSSGGGVSLGGSGVLRLTDKEIDKIINGVVEKIKPLVNIEIPPVDLSSINNLIKENNSKLIQFSNDIQVAFKDRLGKILDIFISAKKDKTVVTAIADVSKIQKDNHKQVQEQVNTVDQKLNHLDHIKVGNRVEELLSKSNKRTDESNNKTFQIMMIELKKEFSEMINLQKINTTDLKTVKLLTKLLDQFLNKQKK